MGASIPAPRTSEGDRAGRAATMTESSMSLRVLLPLLAVALASCGSEPPRWVELARGFQPEPLGPLIERWKGEAGLKELTWTQNEDGVQVEFPVRRADWRAGAAPGTWSLALPGGPFSFGAPGFLRLSSPEGVLHLAREGEVKSAGTFTLVEGRIELELGADRAPPELMRLGQRMENGGRASDGTWQVRLGDECGTGIPVWSGRSQEVVCDVPPGSQLYARVRWSSRSTSGAVELVIRVDGEALYERSVD